MSDKLLVGFLKVRNGILRGDLYRCFQNLLEYCDDVVVVQDASFDGTDQFLRNYLPEENIITVNIQDHSFSNEIFWKQELLQLVHKKGPYGYILWMDSDETLDVNGTKSIREFCENHLSDNVIAWMFKYKQLWRNSSYIRTDSGFDQGNFIKLWKYSPDLSFNVQSGTHRAQFPQQILNALNTGRVQQAPFDCIHWGNFGNCLRFKVLQYYGGLGGVERHLYFDNATYESIDSNTIPAPETHMPGDLPEPFTKDFTDKLLNLKNLTNLEETFCVIIPAYNRADTLPRAIDSVLGQTYQKFIIVVLDDASIDNTEQVVNMYCDADPRVFYCKYLDHRGGVAMHNIGAEIAINTCQWWVRLGSDDWFLPHKLELDAQALLAGNKAVFGPFAAYRSGTIAEMGNLPVKPEIIKSGFLRQGFFASWANVAVSCDILKEVKRIFGSHCDETLINMEDLLVNYRISKITDWIWRGLVQSTEDSSAELVIGVDDELLNKLTTGKSTIMIDSLWNVNEQGASGPVNSSIYAKDSRESQLIIQEDEVMFNKFNKSE